MSLILVGLSHKTAPIELREHLTIPSHQLEKSLHQLKSSKGIKEVVLLSTCNRLEIYTNPDSAPNQTVDSLHNFFRDLYSSHKLPTALYKKEKESAVLHLFRVASGLESLVVGETEVLGQVKSSYQKAHLSGTTGRITNVLFQRALFVGKQVRVKTDISEGASSVGNVAVQLAERIFETLKDRRIVLIGAGKIAEVTVRHLLSKKAGHLTVINRTVSQAKKLAHLLHGEARSLDKIEDELLDADVIICSASSEKPLVSKDMVERLMDQRRNRMLYFIDIAVPRNVHPDVHDIDNVYVYNIDDLRGIVEESLNKRKEAISAAEQLVKEKAEEFSSWLEGAIKGERRPLRHNPDSFLKGES